MSYKYKGSCDCDKVSFVVVLSQSLIAYTPRACDCDFCTKRGIEYLSETGGSLDINSNQPLQKLVQGSKQVHFLSCAGCHTVVCVVYEFSTGLKGAVNATLIEDEEPRQQAVAASPKLLNATQKVERWNSLWLQVKVND